MRFSVLTQAIVAIVGAATFASATASAAEVNVYSARKEALIKPLLDQFSAETGIEVRLLTGGGDALLARLQNEGENTPADLFLTVDAGNLHRAAEAGVFQPITSTELLNQVPGYLHGADASW
ncbi:Fe(3+) ABC transporter substrate-binding protein, partial [Pseudidiomarina aestuarii]